MPWLPSVSILCAITRGKEIQMATLAASKARTEYVVPLMELDRQKNGIAGAKAANLGDLVQAGFPVPDGFVLTTDAFREFVEANRLGPDSSQGTVEDTPLPQELERAIRGAATPLNGT